MLAELPVEQISVVFALLYLAFAIRQSIWCWPAALISVSLWAVVVLDARLKMDFVLQIFYFAMGVYGWHQWRRGGAKQTGVRIHWWPASWHALTVVAVLLVSIAFGWWLSSGDAEFPYLDSFTTIAAIVATFMVARKVMENWIYWFVIDSIYVYLYVERDLFWYAGLYLLYLAMIVIGFKVWLRSMRADEAVTDDPVTA